MIHAEEFIRMKKQLNQIYQKHTAKRSSGSRTIPTAIASCHLRKRPPTV